MKNFVARVVLGQDEPSELLTVNLKRLGLVITVVVGLAGLGGALLGKVVTYAKVPSEVIELKGSVQALGKDVQALQVGQATMAGDVRNMTVGLGELRVFLLNQRRGTVTVTDGTRP